KSSSVAADTLRFLGATVTKYDVTFSYDPCEVIRYIGQIGEMPDIVSHQFYPSSCRISEYVSSLLGAGEGDTLLEPNIGHADLLKSFP
ncbi:restriction endonuclease subunit M, partial [Escherichia coli]|nr:restriction endonuclease subunit M [Escherichia coli]